MKWKIVFTFFTLTRTHLLLSLSPPPWISTIQAFLTIKASFLAVLPGRKHCSAGQSWPGTLPLAGYRPDQTNQKDLCLSSNNN